jgi:small-conductance mechanosensitive channel
VGDWIEIGDIRGEVIDRNLVSTTLTEIDPIHNTYECTGKTIVIPNSLLLTHAVKNMNFMRRYVFHAFTITTEPDVNVFYVKTLILQRIAVYSESFYEVAKRYNGVIEKRSGIDIAGPEPRIRITTTDLGKNAFTVIVFCPAKEAWDLEQKVTDDFMRFYHAQKAAVLRPVNQEEASAS